jgi:gliotoxin/aspirochlorine biosynthesis gamma-glutamylcyclotransferase
MPPEYQQYLQRWPYYIPPTKGYRYIGAKLFLALWVPIMTIMEKITKATVDKEGNGDVPAWVIFLVRFVVVAMWTWHDYIHAPIWGRGDGLDQESGGSGSDLETSARFRS